MCSAIVFSSFSFNRTTIIPVIKRRQLFFANNNKSLSILPNWFANAVSLYLELVVCAAQFTRILKQLQRAGNLLLSRNWLNVAYATFSDNSSRLPSRQVKLSQLKHLDCCNLVKQFLKPFPFLVINLLICKKFISRLTSRLWEKNIYYFTEVPWTESAAKPAAEENRRWNLVSCKRKSKWIKINKQLAALDESIVLPRSGTQEYTNGTTAYYSPRVDN